MYIILLIEPTDRNILKAWDFCATKSCSIEVVYRDAELGEEVLTRLHFSVNVKVITIVGHRF